MQVPQVHAKIIKASAPIKKAEVSTEIQAVDDGIGFITPAVDLRGLKHLVNNSSILPQCIRAYKNNIAGFGIGIRYKEDKEETPEMKAEWEKITQVIEYLNMDQDTKEVFEDIIEARETYGIAYLEVIRNFAGEVVGIEFINNTPSVQKTAALTPYVEVEYEMNGKTEKRRKKFCKYRQQLNGKTVYFKEIGDPRIMDNRSGEYVDNTPIENQANEILEFAIGTEPYGEVRWLGTVLNVDGSRRAENLNNRYFSDGRHTPLMILLNGGNLTEDSYSKLQGYMDEIKGENGQHAFIVLEAENLENRTDMEGDIKPNVEIVKMADILQKDELFQDYLNNNRRKVQSAFQLPDLYVGYTTDFNRATAQSAQEVTEKQVFQPERQSLAWLINNKLLADYHFKYVEAYFLEPDISNPDDLFKLLTVCNNAGGLTPNKAKEIIYKAFGEVSENYEGEWADLPLAYSQAQSGQDAQGLDEQMSQQVQKSVENNDEEITVVLKEIRKMLLKGAWSEEDHPRDENGRFVGNGAPAVMRGQYADIEAMNEYDYFSEQQEAVRKNAIAELTGYNEEQTQQALSALCGCREDYLRMADIGAAYSFGWFYGQDSDIRNLATQNAIDKANIINQYIKDAPKFEGTAYRGLALDNDTIQALKSGGSFQEKGVLTSWSDSKSVAEEFANGRSEELDGKKPVIFKCSNIKESTPAAHLSIYGKDEGEVLVSNFTNKSYSVVSVNVQNGVTIFEVSED